MLSALIAPIMIVHVSAGGIGLLAGAAALIFRKGAQPHRMIGRVYVGAMVIMAASAGYLGVMGKFGIGASLSGALVFYLVASGWLTTQRQQRGIGLGEFAGFFIGLCVLAAYVLLAMQTPPRWIAGPLVGVIIAGFGVLLDIVVIVRGGISGAGRIARHVWRMCLPLFQASSFFFLAQPALFHGVPMPALLAPPVIVVVLMIFWLLRTHLTAQFESASPDLVTP